MFVAFMCVFVWDFKVERSLIRLICISMKELFFVLETHC